MRMPPLLMAAGLLFWGWQSDFLPVAAAMAVVLESPRIFKARWELTDAEIIRIWNFCSLLGLGTVVYAFTSNEGPANFTKLFEDANLQTSQLAGNSSTQSAISLIRWLPLIFLLFVAAQAFSSRAEFPLETISPFLRYRRKQLLKSRRPAPPVRQFNSAWPFFVLCLLAASAHAALPGDNSFFWGLCGLITWALWTQRPRGSVVYVWLTLLTVVVASGFFGLQGIGVLGRMASLANNYNPPWLSMFLRQRTDPEQSRTAIGHIGRLKMSSQIVLRVAPVGGVEVPTYLREATYRTYYSSVWFVGGSGNDDSTIPETPINSGHWPLQSGPTNRYTVNIFCYLNGSNPKDGNPLGLLPLPVDAASLDHLPAYALQNNSLGSVLAEGPGLLIFNAAYGSGLAMDSPPSTNDLAVPDKEKPALDRVVAQLPLNGLKDPQKIIAVSRYFAANYNYSMWQRDLRSTSTNTALADFLLTTHSGHCEYFATATVLLLRELHIPARYAVGYYVHETAGKHYVVRDRDAHAWCLVWDPAAKTWSTLDTTPASWVAEEGKRASPWQFITDLFSWLHLQFAKFRYGQTHLRPYLLMAMVPVLGYLLYQIIFHRRRHQSAAAGKAGQKTNWPGLDSEFYLLEQKLARRGLTRRPGEPLSDWLQQAVADPSVAGHRQALRHLLQLHYRHRFDPHGLSPAERDELRRQARECLATIP